jgi:hypothetical protein
MTIIDSEKFRKIRHKNTFRKLTDDFPFPGLKHRQAGDYFVPLVQQENVFFNGIHRGDTQNREVC